MTIKITNARFSYPHLGTPASLMRKRAPSFEMSITLNSNPLVLGWMMYGVMGRISWSALTGHDPQKLLPSNRRCEMCLVEFEAEHHWHDIREYWIERSHFCETCSQARVLNMAALFDPKVIMDSIYQATGLSDFLKLDPMFPGDEIVFDKPASRRLAPFVSPLTDSDEIETVEPWPHKVAIVGADYGAIELRTLAAMSGIRGIVIDLTAGGGEIAGRNHQLELYAAGVAGYDYSAMLKRDKLRTKAARAKAPPSYLKHDPSKGHSRRRK